MRSLSLALFTLVACTTDPPPPPAATPPAPSAAASTELVPASRHSAKEGEMCGGFAGIRCAAGLTCTMKGPVYPDRAGTCTKDARGPASAP